MKVYEFVYIRKEKWVSRVWPPLHILLIVSELTNQGLSSKTKSITCIADHRRHVANYFSFLYFMYCVYIFCLAVDSPQEDVCCIQQQCSLSSLVALSMHYFHRILYIIMIRKH